MCAHKPALAFPLAPEDDKSQPSLTCIPSKCSSMSSRFDGVFGVGWAVTVVGAVAVVNRHLENLQ